MQYAPKLKTAMEEIKEILHKHDIAGIVILHTPGHGEYLNHITPSYSCASIDTLKGRFQMKGKKVHFENEADRLNKMRDTSNMLSILADLTSKTAMNLIHASESADKLCNSEHTSGNDTSHQTQNN